MPEWHFAILLHSPHLFVALLLQIFITTEQMPEDVETQRFWRACREEHGLPSEPNRCQSPCPCHEFAARASAPRVTWPWLGTQVCSADHEGSALPTGLWQEPAGSGAQAALGQPALCRHPAPCSGSAGQVRSPSPRCHRQHLCPVPGAPHTDPGACKREGLVTDGGPSRLQKAGRGGCPAAAASQGAHVPLQSAGERWDLCESRLGEVCPPGSGPWCLFPLPGRCAGA